jgi:hypothetical protein
MECMSSDTNPFELIPSLAAWYDADDASTIHADNDIVREWLDKSRNGWDLKPSATLGGQLSPTHTVDRVTGLGSITFNGASPFLRTINSFAIAGKDERSIFTVAAGGLQARPGSIVHWGAAERGRAYGIAFEENIVVYRWSDNLFLATNDQITPGLVSATYDGVTHKAWLNGYLATQDTHEIDTVASPLQIGGRGTSTYPGIFHGGIAEIVIFNSAVTENERVFIEGVLAWKWGLAAYLPPVHPYANISPRDAK